jgi:glycerol-3-phosphate dehydrogenase
MIGLTDDPHAGAEIPDAPRPTQQDIGFLLATASAALATPLTEDDIVGSFAGLRPLLDTGERQTADISREHTVTTDPDSSAVTIVGGKLTTYRRMAQDAVDAVTDARCRTQRLPLVGAGERPTSAPPRLIRRYGSEAAAITTGHDPVAPGLPALQAEFATAVEREGALTADDLLDIHTRLGLVPAWREQAQPVASDALETIASSRPTIWSA